MATFTAPGADRMSQGQADWESLPGIRMSIILPSRVSKLLSETAKIRSQSENDLICEMLEKAVRREEPGTEPLPRKPVSQTDWGSLIGVRVSFVVPEELDRSLSRIAASRSESENDLICEMLKESVRQEESKDSRS